MAGAEMHDRMLMIDRKLDAIMAHLGMKSPFPSDTGLQGSQECAALDSLPSEPFMVFRNDAYENLSQGITSASQSSGDDAYLSPGSQLSAATHISPAKLENRTPDGGADAEEQHQHKGSDPHYMPNSHQDDRHYVGSSASVEYPASLASMLSSIHSARSLESNNTGACKSNKVPVPILPDQMRTKKVQTAGKNNHGEDGNKLGRESSRSGSMRDHSQTPELQGSNKGELSWRDIVPCIGISSREASPIRAGKTTVPPARRSKEDLPSRGSAPPKCRSRLSHPNQRSTSVRTTKPTETEGNSQLSMSRREMLRTKSSQSMTPATQVASFGRQDSSSNIEVVKQIQQKIYELRQRESLDKPLQESHLNVQPHQREDPTWLFKNWDKASESMQGLENIEDLDDAFPAPPVFCNSLKKIHPK